MTAPACRFESDGQGLEGTCSIHHPEGRADICDIGLAALYEEIASLKHYKAMTENQLVVYEKHEASPAYATLRAQLEELNLVGVAASQQMADWVISEKKYIALIKELEKEADDQARVIAAVYTLMRRYDGTIGAVSPLRTFLTELDKALSPTKSKEA